MLKIFNNTIETYSFLGLLGKTEIVNSAKDEWISIHVTINVGLFLILLCVGAMGMQQGVTLFEEEALDSYMKLTSNPQYSLVAGL